jgi:hypothetical protein
VQHNNPNKDLEYQYEILRARHELGEIYLNNVVKEVYENVGQILSLVRIRLSMLEPCDNKKKETIEESGILVQSAITNLKRMCGRFCSQKEMFTTTRFVEIIKQEMSQYSPTPFKINGVLPVTDPGTNLILFSTLVSIFNLLNSENNEIINAEMNFNCKKIDVIIDHRGNSIEWVKVGTKKGQLVKADFVRRVKLVGGRLKTKNIQAELSRIKLIITL